MNTIINFGNIDHLPTICNSPVKWILLQTEAFSRFGGLPDNSLKDVVAELKQNRKKIVLAWDYVAKDNESRLSFQLFESIKKGIDSVRFLDPGLGKTLESLFPGIRLQLSLEHGSLNRYSVRYWTDIFKSSLERVVLSSQLPLSTIQSIRNLVPCDIEILGLGSIEIFYSRRKLLSKHIRYEDIVNSNPYVASEDRPDQFNRIIQTTKGTIVFYDKPLNVFNRLIEIKEAGIDHLRIEIHEKDHFKAIASFFEKPNWPDTLSECRLNRSFEGFLQFNETKQLFERLTNPVIRSEIENKIGVVLESVRNSFTIIEFTKQTRLPSDFVFVSPENIKIDRRFEKIEDLKGINHFDILQPGVYTVPWIKYIVPGSVVKLLKG